MSFENWKERIDKELEIMCGMWSNDIDDWCYADDYAVGLSPKASAKRALKNAKSNCGLS